MQVFKIQQQSTTSRQFFAKRLSSVVAREARRAATRTKNTKDVQTRAKRVMREMQTFLRGNEKREREARKKAEKEALEKARREEEVREAKRQARKLNFLITQTELYSHFVGSKIKSTFLCGFSQRPPLRLTLILLLLHSERSRRLCRYGVRSQAGAAAAAERFSARRDERQRRRRGSARSQL